jgi:hypothetical protein
MRIDNGTGKAAFGAPACPRGAYPMDSPPHAHPRVTDTGGTMTETLTAPIADALADALNAANGAIATEGASGAILADLAKRYRIALADHEMSQQVLRLHRRRGAYYAARFTDTDAPTVERITGLTFAEALERFGVTKKDGSRLDNTTAQYRDGNVFQILATLRPSLHNVDTLSGRDVDVFEMWAATDAVARKKGATPALLAAARETVRVVAGKVPSIRPEPSKVYADPFSGEAFDALMTEWGARFSLVRDAVNSDAERRKVDAERRKVADAEKGAALALAAGEGSVSQHVREDASTSEGTRADSTGADRPNGDDGEDVPDVLSADGFAAELLALAARYVAANAVPSASAVDKAVREMRALFAGARG